MTAPHFTIPKPKLKSLAVVIALLAFLLALSTTLNYQANKMEASITQSFLQTLATSTGYLAASIVIALLFTFVMPTDVTKTVYGLINDHQLMEWKG